VRTVRAPRFVGAFLASVVVATAASGAAAAHPSSAPGDRQEARAFEGRLVRGADSTALADRTVVLHRVSPDSGFAVDSVVSAMDGGFSFSLPRAEDSATVHVVSARHEGTVYFGPVIHGSSPPSPYVVTVYDTAVVEGGESLSFPRRTLALTADETGTRVLDVTEIGNETARTLVGPGSGAAWWRLSLPSGATSPTVLSGGVAPEEVDFGAGEVRASASVPPSGVRLVLGYTLPASAPLTLVLGQPVSSLEVVYRGSRNPRSGSGLEATEPVISEGRRFERFVGEDLETGDTVRLELGAEASADVGGAAWALLALSLLLALAAWMSWRRFGGASPGPDAVARDASA
jgi:hypothetical protein